MEWKGALSAQSQNQTVSILTPVFAANCHADAIARILLASPPEGTKSSFPVFIAFDFFSDYLKKLCYIAEESLNYFEIVESGGEL